MATITIKLNERSKAGKALQEILAIFSKEPGVEIIQEKSPYNPEFVKKIKKSEQQIKEGKFKVLNSKDVWGSLGL
jgi:hypothetical protein